MYRLLLLILGVHMVLSLNTGNSCTICPQRLEPKCAKDSKTGQYKAFPSECAVNHHNCMHSASYSVVEDKHCPNLSRRFGPAS